MKSLLLETTGFNLATGWPVLLLLGLLAILLIVNIFTRKKQGDKQMDMLNNLKKGDKVVTNAGIYGEIVSITETNFGKILLLKTGEDKNFSYISVNMSVVIGIDTKEPITYDKDGNVVEQKAEQKVEEQKEEQLDKDSKEEKSEKTKESNPTKKSSSKKSTKKA